MGNEPETKDIEDISAEEFISRVDKDLCFDVGNYPYYLIPEILSEEKSIIKAFNKTSEEGKREEEKLYLFNSFIHLRTECEDEKNLFHLVDVSDIPNDRRVRLEQRIAEKAEQLITTYENHSAWAVKYHLRRATDDLVEVCLKLNPGGYYKELLRIGIVEKYQERRDNQVEGIRVKLLDKQGTIRPYKEIVESEKRLEELKSRPLPDPEEDIMEFISAEYGIMDAEIDRIMKIADENHNYSKIRSVLTNSNLDITPVNTTLVFYYCKFGGELKWIQPGRLISILPSEKQIGDLGFSDVCKYVSNNRN